MSIMPYVFQGLSQEDPSYDSLLDPWAFPFEVETDKGGLVITIADEDRFFNINYLPKDEIYRKIFSRLLEILEISPGYTERILYYMGKGGAPYEFDYPPKGAPLDSAEELRYIGLSQEELYGKKEGEISFPGLLELVTVHSSGKININTAPKYVLMALDPGIDSTVAERIIEYRTTKPFKKPQDLVLVEGVTLDMLYRIEKVIDVKSTNFRILATVRAGDVETTLEVVYDRKKRGVVYTKIY
jgi:general secretion pathway protein K